MAWYWLVLIAVLALNGLLIVLLGLVMLRDWLRARRSASAGDDGRAGERDVGGGSL